MYELIILFLSYISQPIRLIFIYFSKKKKQKHNQIVKLYKILNSNKIKKPLIVCELFKDLTSLQMSYSNIKTLFEDDNVLIIIHLLRNYKNLYCYDNNKLISLENKKFKNIKEIFLKIFLLCVIIFTGIITVYVINSDLLIYKLVYSILLIFLFSYLVIYIRMNEDIALAEKIIKKYDN